MPHTTATSLTLNLRYCVCLARGYHGDYLQVLLGDKAQLVVKTAQLQRQLLVLFVESFVLVQKWKKLRLRLPETLQLQCATNSTSWRDHITYLYDTQTHKSILLYV